MSLFDEEDKASQQRAVALIRPLIPANAENAKSRICTIYLGNLD